jgi:hypothetical protein
MALDYTPILTALGQALSVVRDGSGPLQTGQLVHLHIEPSNLDLKVPMLLDGQLNLSFLTKSVRFADAAFPTTTLVDYLQDPSTILGGMPVPELEVPMQGPTLTGAIPMGVQVNVTGGGGAFLPPRVASAAPDVQLPEMAVPAASSENALSGVPGLLGELAGTIPIPALVPVQLDVTWKVTRLDGVPITSGDFNQLGTGTDVLFLFFGALEELTTALPTPRTFLVTATVTLTLPATTPVIVGLPPIPLIVPAIPIPTIMLLSNKTNFGVDSIRDDDDNARMVMVPGNSPIQDRTSLTVALNNFANLLNQLTTIPGPPWWAPGLLGTLGTLIDLVNSYVPVGDRYPLVVVRSDVVGDTSSINFSSSTFGSDNFDDEDEAVLLIGIPATKLSLTTGDNFDGDRMDIFTGTEMFVLINDLGSPQDFKPQPLTSPPSEYLPPDVSNTPSVKNNLETIGFNH